MWGGTCDRVRQPSVRAARGSSFVPKRIGPRVDSYKADLVSRIVREKQRYGLRLMLGDDGAYAVEADGTEIFRSRVLSAAEIEFDEAFNARSQAAVGCSVLARAGQCQVRLPSASRTA